jgi:hypothetical protein
MKNTIVGSILALLCFLALGSTTALADGSVPQQCCKSCTCSIN